MRTVLSRRNCHRAKKVMHIDAPEQGIYDLEWRGIKTRSGLLRNDFAHAITLPDNPERLVIQDIESAMKEWEIVEFIPVESLDELWDIAVRAFSGTSFVPEERAAMYIKDYEETLTKDLAELSKIEGIDEDALNQYRVKFTDKVRDLFAKHSRIISAMITGPANFPAARNEKANRSYNNAFNEFQAWRERYFKLAKKKIEDAKSPEERANAEWEALKRDINECFEICGRIDNGERGMRRNAFTMSLLGKINRAATNGKFELVSKALELIKTMQADKTWCIKRPLFTERHSIWRLTEVCQRAIQRQKEMANKESNEFEFRGCRIVKNYAEDRIQLIFDGKPEPAMISALKSNGFRWSPRFTAWQRQLTSNSYYGVARVFFGNDWNNNERAELLKKLNS